MRKKTAACLLLIFSVYATACGTDANINTQTIDTQNEISEIEDTQIESEDVIENENVIKENPVNETTAEESVRIEDSSKDDVSDDDNSLVTFTENENGYRLYYADKENYMLAYKKYLTDNLDEYYFSTLICERDYYYYYPYYDAQFCLYDLNGDGMKELIVCGALGLRCKMLSAVAYWDGDTFTSIEYPGEPRLIGSNMIMFNNPDYGGSGEIRYTNEYVDFFDEKGLSKTILNYNLDEQYTEKEDAEDSFETIYEAYFVEDTEVSEETYKAQKELLVKQMENIEMYDLTLENIEKYVTE